MVLEGYKTYIAAFLAMAAAAYEIFIAGNMKQGFDYFTAGLSLIGIRSAIGRQQ